MVHAIKKSGDSKIDMKWKKKPIKYLKIESDLHVK